MADREPLVALLFDDAGLSAHLREALVEQGARIVYESDLDAFAPAELVGSSADVVVVDLDDPSDDDLDRLYDTVEGGHPRLVFNDADASRNLAGWDRARWARHLAAKLVGETPLDPPRPDHARAIEPRVAVVADASGLADAVAESRVEDVAITGSHGYPEAPEAPAEAQAFVSLDTIPDIEGDLEDELAFSTPLSDADEDEPDADAGKLAAELEALLADAGNDAAAYDDGLETVPSTPVALTELASLDLSGFELVDETPVRTFDTDGLSLSPMEGDAADAPALQIEARATQYVPPPVPEWDLVDPDTIVADTPARPDPSAFGLETISAAEFLAQDIVDDGSHDLEPGLSLELVSMEEAVAPRTDSDFAHEMFLDAGSSAVRRVVALGGTQDSEASIAAFLAALPTQLPALLLVAVHHDEPTEALASRLGRGRAAEDGARATHGDCLVVPKGAHVQVRRDGSVTVRDDGNAAGVAGPSIDGIFSTLAGGFGADALGIVFAGRGNDAVAGSQALYDAGGSVWVESVPAEHEAGHMVAGVREERVASFAGDAAALAGKLIGELS